METNRTSAPIMVTGGAQVRQEPPARRAPRALKLPSRLALALDAGLSCQLGTVPTESWAREGARTRAPWAEAGRHGPAGTGGGSGPQAPRTQSTGGEGTGAELGS